jgi:hypothetical protein
MREIRTYGLMRERASLAEPSLLYFNFSPAFPLDLGDLGVSRFGALGQ